MSTGLIFEGGGMRGVFSAGVIDFLLEKDVRPDIVYGVSAGASGAASFVCGQKGRACATMIDYLDDPHFMGMKSLRKTGNYFNTDFLYHQIPEKLNPIDQKGFEERGIRLKIAITNCITGEAEYPEIHDMIEDMDLFRASSSLPLLAQMVPLNGYVYLDGGIADSVPIRRSEEDGNEKNIVVLTRPLGYRKKQEYAILPMIRAKYRRYPKLIEAMEHRPQVYNETLEYIQAGMESGSVFVIAPMGPLGIHRTETDRSKLVKAYHEGYYVAEGLYDRLLHFLEK